MKKKKEEESCLQNFLNYKLNTGNLKKFEIHTFGDIFFPIIKGKFKLYKNEKTKEISVLHTLGDLFGMCYSEHNYPKDIEKSKFSAIMGLENMFELYLSGLVRIATKSRKLYDVIKEHLETFDKRKINKKTVNEWANPSKDLLAYFKRNKNKKHPSIYIFQKTYFGTKSNSITNIPRLESKLRQTKKLHHMSFCDWDKTIKHPTANIVKYSWKKEPLGNPEIYKIKIKVEN